MSKRNDFLDEVASDTTKSGYESGIDRLLDALDDETADQIRAVLLDPKWGHARIHRALIARYADHPALEGKRLTAGQVTHWRSERGIRLR